MIIGDYANVGKPIMSLPFGNVFYDLFMVTLRMCFFLGGSTTLPNNILAIIIIHYGNPSEPASIKERQ